MPQEFSIFAVGDVFVDRDEPMSAFTEAGRALREGDIVFGNCEGVFSDRWERTPSCGSPVVAPAANANALAQAGFTVMSLANNHSLDGGHEAMLSTRETLQKLGIQTAGAGEDAERARAAATVSVGETRVAFLAYSAVFPHGYEARAAAPGLLAGSLGAALADRMFELGWIRRRRDKDRVISLTETGSGGVRDTFGLDESVMATVTTG